MEWTKDMKCLYYFSDSEGSYVQPETQIIGSNGRPSIAESEYWMLNMF